MLKQEAQPPQRNSASATNVFLGWLYSSCNSLKTVAVVQPWPKFRVTWRYRSRDRSIYHRPFRIRALLVLTLYLQGISRYWGSNVSGNVTSSFTWSFHSHRVISYRCSIDTNPLSWAVREILSLIWVVTLTFRASWCYALNRLHTFPLTSPYRPTGKLPTCNGF